MTNTASQYVSLSEAAKELAYADASTLRRHAHEGRIPGAIKIGNSWAIPAAWVEEKKREPVTQGKGWAKGRARK